MSFVNRQLYKQKPSAWGPVSAVQASIFKNAEKIGINPKKIKLILPLWNPGTQRDYSKYDWPIYSPNFPATFINNGLSFVSATARAYGLGGTATVPAELKFGGTDPFFINTVFDPTFMGTDRYIFAQKTEIILRKGSLTTLDFILNSFTTNDRVSIPIVYGLSSICAGYNQQENKLFISSNATMSSVSPTGTYGNDNNELCLFGTNYNDTASAAATICTFVLIIADNISNGIARYFNDNPYFLLHRVPTVFYSVPGGAGGVTISSTTGTVVVTGYAVGIETGVTISVNTGIITGTGFNVEVEQGTSVQVTTGEISINGLNPDIVQGIQFIVTKGMVTINSFDTTVLNGTEINVTSKNVSITGYAVEVEQGIIITSSIESIIITGYNVSVTNELVISLNVGSVIIAGYNTTVLAGTRIDLTKVEITITCLDLEIEQGTQIDVTSETVIVTGLDVSVENTLSINVTTGSVNVLGYPVSVYAGILVEATTGNVAITGYNPTIAQSSGVEVTTGQVTITGLDTTIECTVLIEPTTGMVIIASYDVTVTDSLVAETPITRTNVVAASNRVIINSGSSRLMTNSNFSRLIVIT